MDLATLEVLTLEQFKARAQKGERPEARVVKGVTAAAVKVLDPATRTLDVRISTVTRDRDGDTIDPAGWKLVNFRKNPVVLWCHDYGSLPVAKDLGLQQDEVGLRGTPQFTDPALYPLGDTVFRMYQEGFLSAFSVGMQPQLWAYNEAEGGIDFQEQELLEYSCVPVPANPEALVGAKSAGIDLSPLRGWAEKTLDTWESERGLWIPREKVERALKVLEGGRTVVFVPGRFSEAEAKAFASEHGATLVVRGAEAPAEAETPETPAAADPAPAPAEPEAPVAEGVVIDLDALQAAADADLPAEAIAFDPATLREALTASVGAAVDDRLRQLTGRLPN